MPRGVPKGCLGLEGKKLCPYCGRKRSRKLFKEKSDICNFCSVFDRAALITDPYRDPEKGNNKA